MCRSAAGLDGFPRLVPGFEASAACMQNEARGFVPLDGEQTPSVSRYFICFMKTTFSSLLVTLAGMGLSTHGLRAEVRLPSIFGDHMVLQQGHTVPVWGWAEPGEDITVTFQTLRARTTATPEGTWRVDLPALPYGDEPAELTVQGKNRVRFTDVLVGDVWVCSGQSNMEWPLWDTTGGRSEVAKAHYPAMRLFRVAHKTSLEPVSDCEGTWVVCTPESSGGFSAVGYYFGRDLHRHTGRPLGLIGSHWGGSFIQAWTSLAGLRSDSAFGGAVAAYEQVVANRAQYEAEYYSKTLPAWEAESKRWVEEVKKPHEAAMRLWALEMQKAKKEGKPLPSSPGQPRPMQGKPTCRSESMNNPTVLFNGMISPLIPYAIGGVLWYQGESNANVPALYAKMLPALITDWRRHWGQGDFPFLFVQLPNLNTPADWAAFREAQSKALTVPATGMAVTIDLGDPKDLHPRAKAEVGTRLARIARRIAYGEPGVDSGPRFRDMQVEGSRLRIAFENAGGGLVANPAEDGRVKGFVVAGLDGVFFPAEAQIQQQSVIVWSEAVKQPVAARYGWASAPEVNLFNREGFPAWPFRTDDWPLAGR